MCNQIFLIKCTSFNFVFLLLSIDSQIESNELCGPKIKRNFYSVFWSGYLVSKYVVFVCDVSDRTATVSSMNSCYVTSCW